MVMIDKTMFITIETGGISQAEFIEFSHVFRCFYGLRFWWN
jgi:hypothetical protein